MSEKKTAAPGPAHALIVFAGVLLILGIGLFGLSASIHALLVLCLVWTLANVRWLRIPYVDARRMMSAGISEALPAIYIFLLIGMVIASFMMSGTIAALIVWGLDWLSPGPTGSPGPSGEHPSGQIKRPDQSLLLHPRSGFSARLDRSE